MLFSPLDLLPTSVTAVAHEAGDLVGTMSAVICPVGALPSGKQFEADLEEFGVEGRIVCEFTKLACVDDRGPIGEQAVLWIVGYLLEWCSRNLVDDVFCVTHPRHALAWNRIFGWSPISAVKSCPHVNAAPGVLLHIDLRRLQSDRAAISVRGRRILSECAGMCRQGATSYRMTGSEAALLMLQCPDPIDRTNTIQRSLLTRYYPWATTFIERFMSSAAEPWRPLSFTSLRKPHRERGYSFSLHGPRPDSSQPPELFSGEEPRFLVVGGTPYLQSVMRRQLRDRNYHCSIVRDPAIARKHAQRERFDLVLLSEKLQGEQGQLFADEIRDVDGALRRHTPILQLRAAQTSGETLRRGGERPLKQWVYEYSSPTLLLRALDTLSSAPPKRDYQAYAEELSGWSRETVRQRERAAAHAGRA
ncbi:MAG: response regulator [Bdellovibrionota bacterium]